MTVTAPPRRRTRCAICALRRLCWPIKVRTLGWHVAEVPVCDECVWADVLPAIREGLTR